MFLGVGLVAVRVAVDARQALARAERSAAAGDTRMAIREYLLAGRLYVPGLGTTDAALSGLVHMGKVADGRGDHETARRALEAARSVILGTRWLATPGGDRRDEIDRALAQQLAALELAGGSKVAPGEAAAWHLDRLAQPVGPALGPSLLALLGFGLWLGATVGFIFRGVDVGCRLRLRPALLCGALFVVGFGLFVVALRFA